ncbi:MAG: sugar-binding domain-containing protein, partial [Lachnospiraceae bacterium]
MKEITKFNCNWIFLKDVTEAPTSLPTTGEVVNLPHTWNAIDGQDGGCDYWRGTCCYANVLGKYENKRVYIEVLAASSSATICVNGKEVISHDGGYSIFRADITDALTEEENLIAILVDNGSNDRVYPQTADFTFYGGLYRGVNIITVDESHFDLDYYGGKGLTFSAEVEEDAAIITLDAYVTEPTAEQNVEFVIRDAEGKQVASAVCTASAHVNTQL